MSVAMLPLQDLAQRLTQKQAELEEARRAYEARLAELARRKNELQADLRDVNAEIQAVSSATAPGPAPSAARTPAGPAAPPAPQGRAEGAPTLVRFLLNLVRAAGRPMTVKELAEEVVRAKYPTTSGNIPGLVKNTISKLVTQKLLRRADGQPGVVLAQPRAGKPAGDPRATPARPPATEQKVPANGKAANPAAPGGRRGQPSLGDLLTRLLAESQRPLKAKELAEQALAAGYKTESKDFLNVIWVALGKMDVENVPGQGYRLKQSASPSRTP